MWYTNISMRQENIMCTNTNEKSNREIAVWFWEVQILCILWERFQYNSFENTYIFQKSSIATVEKQNQIYM